MSILFLEYPKCSTCQKAKKWLQEQHISFTDRNIVENNPTEKELSEWLTKSNLPLQKFFNTSGRIYKEKNLKEELPKLSQEEQIKLLATNGMLVKRPLIIGDDFVLIGFHEKEWQRLC